MRLVSVLFDNFNPWNIWFPTVECAVIYNPDHIQKDDILILHGGEDISPALYNKKVNRFTGAGDTPSKRDALEWDCILKAKELGSIIVGICRGAQMLCAAAGGTLVQHVSNHGGNHEILTSDGETITVNSAHHQMMNPTNTEHKILAVANPTRSEKYHGEPFELIDMTNEPEAIWFPSMRGLAVQWHPEWMSYKSPASQWIYKQLVNL